MSDTKTKEDSLIFGMSPGVGKTEMAEALAAQITAQSQHPPGVVILSGSTGTGKTETAMARALAENPDTVFLFGAMENASTIDLSSLFGHAAGYCVDEPLSASATIKEKIVRGMVKSGEITEAGCTATLAELQKTEHAGLSGLQVMDLAAGIQQRLIEAEAEAARRCARLQSCQEALHALSAQRQKLKL